MLTVGKSVKFNLKIAQKVVNMHKCPVAPGAVLPSAAPLASLFSLLQSKYNPPGGNRRLPWALLTSTAAQSRKYLEGVLLPTPHRGTGTPRRVRALAGAGGASFQASHSQASLSPPSCPRPQSLKLRAEPGSRRGGWKKEHVSFWLWTGP